MLKIMKGKKTPPAILSKLKKALTGSNYKFKGGY
tara:strand:- start:1175 stop:1276 length:102 start_codon:yes stop_codon:yes gene_type:complete